MFASSGVAYLGARVTYAVWPRGSSLNDGWPKAEGLVHWDPHTQPSYVFWDPRMEVAINESRWATVLRELDPLLGLA